MCVDQKVAICVSIVVQFRVTDPAAAIEQVAEYEDRRASSGRTSIAASTPSDKPQLHDSDSARYSSALLSKYRYDVPLDTPDDAALPGS